MRDCIIIDVHQCSTSESWLVVYKDGRVRYHIENDGHTLMRRGPEEQDTWLTMDEVRALGRSGMLPADDVRPFIERVEEAIRLLNTSDE
jgi:hypothetical protein